MAFVRVVVEPIADVAFDSERVALPGWARMVRLRRASRGV
jgi:hypothetical protein